MPTVSVIIPTYQRAGFVGQAIDSVLAQTYTDYEIIVVDDGSTDNTRDVLTGYGDRLRVIYQENRGAGAARNTGIRAAQGRYIAFLDDDDLWFPHKLERQIPILDANPEAALGFTDLVGFDVNGIRETRYSEHYPPLIDGGATALFRYNFIGGATVCARRRCLEEIGLFDETLLATDYDLWLRMIEHWPFRYLDEPLYYYRQSPDQQQRNAGAMNESVVRVKEKAYDRNLAIRHLPRATLDTVYFAGYLSLARRHLSAGRRREARSVLQRYRARRGVTRPYLKLWAASWLPLPLFHALSGFRQRSAALTNSRD